MLRRHTLQRNMESAIYCQAQLLNPQQPVHNRAFLKTDFSFDSPLNQKRSSLLNLRASIFKGCFIAFERTNFLLYTKTTLMYSKKAHRDIALCAFIHNQPLFKISIRNNPQIGFKLLLLCAV